MGKKARAKIKGVIAGVVVGVVVLVAVVVLMTVVLCRMTNGRLIKTWPRPTLDLVEVKGTWTYMYVYNYCTAYTLPVSKGMFSHIIIQSFHADDDT